jgi:hypothetical protein
MRFSVEGTSWSLRDWNQQTQLFPEIVVLVQYEVYIRPTEVIQSLEHQMIHQVVLPSAVDNKVNEIVSVIILIRK